MLEPHAYIPLDARLLNKKNHKEAVAHFGVVVKSGKKINSGKDGKIVSKGSGRGSGRGRQMVGNRKQRRQARENSAERRG